MSSGKRTREDDWGEPCPVRISTGDGGVDSRGLSTQRAMPNNFFFDGKPPDDICVLFVPTFDRGELYTSLRGIPIFEVVKMAYFIERQLDRAGFADVFCEFLKTKCLQTHVDKHEQPMLSIRFPTDTANSFLPGAWYFKHKHCSIFKKPVFVIQVLRLPPPRKNATHYMATIRQVFYQNTSFGDKLAHIRNTHRLKDVIEEIAKNDKPIVVHRVSQTFNKQVTTCLCCNPPSQAIIISRVTICATHRVIGGGRIFDPSKF